VACAAGLLAIVRVLARRGARTAARASQKSSH
jgi:hypothetical protein